MPNSEILSPDPVKSRLEALWISLKSHSDLRAFLMRVGGSKPSDVSASYIALYLCRDCTGILLPTADLVAPCVPVGKAVMMVMAIAVLVFSAGLAGVVVIVVVVVVVVVVVALVVGGGGVCLGIVAEYGLVVIRVIRQETSVLATSCSCNGW